METLFSICLISALVVIALLIIAEIYLLITLVIYTFYLIKYTKLQQQIQRLPINSLEANHIESLERELATKMEKTIRYIPNIR